MAKKRSIKKVTAFITRVLAEEVDLLLFKHPEASAQLPAGTVEVGEHPNDAVIREASEKTGLKSLKPIKLLGHQHYFLSDGEMVILRMTKLFDEPSYDSSSGGLILNRGSTVRVQDNVGEFTLVAADLNDNRAHPESRITNVAGYVRTSLLTNRIEGYFFHLQSLDDRQDQWEVSADGHIFKCFWKRLVSEIEINKWQQLWLMEYREEIIRSSRFSPTTKPGIE